MNPPSAPTKWLLAFRFRRRLVVIVMFLPGLIAMLSAPASAADHTPVQARQQAALALYGQLASANPTHNLIFSPASIASVMAAITEGARGATRTELERFLGFSGGEADGSRDYRPLFDRLDRLGKLPNCQLTMTSKIWVQAGLPLQPDFVNVARDRFLTEITNIDFRAPKTAAIAINDWAAAASHDEIKDLIPPAAISLSTRLIAANTIYFKARWQFRFDRSETKSAVFYSPKRGRFGVEMMHQSTTLPYAAAGRLRALELPYEGGELSMLILLPDQFDGLSELEHSLPLNRLNALISVLHLQQVNVALPKFELYNPYQLAPPLIALGVREAFAPSADFSGITSVAGLSLSSVAVKSVIEVNEEGAKAAGSTSADMDMARPAVESGPLVDFRVDHPFLFLIRDRRTGDFLFIGRLIAPP